MLILSWLALNLRGFGHPAYLSHTQNGFYPLPQVLKIVVQF